MNGRILTGTAASLALVAALVACTVRDGVAVGCLDGSRPTIRVPSDQTTPWPPSSLFVANDTAINAIGRVFDHTVPKGNFRVGVKIHEPAAGGSQRVNLCVVGGTSSTSLPPETTPWETWHDTYGFVQENPSPTIVGVRLFNTGDGLVFTHRADNWRVIGIRVDGGGAFAGGYIHDDCIENDQMLAGSVRDSKFDGCHVFLSSMNDDAVPPPDGTGSSVLLDGILVRLQPFQNSYNTEKYGVNRHGGFFKWSGWPSTGIPPHLVVRNSVFRSDTPAAYGGNTNGKLGLPAGSTCDHVTLIGTAAWPPDELESWTRQCTNLTLGTVDDWDARVAAWDELHPEMAPSGR